VPTPGQKYKSVLEEYRTATARRSPDAEKAGMKLREAALERADRREWAHKRRGDEQRWQE
jgi:hypothetical protein